VGRWPFYPSSLMPNKPTAMSDALLPQPGGFEGLRAIGEVLLPEDQAPPQPEELEGRDVHGHAAARSMSPVLNRGEKLVAQVEDLLGFRVEILEGVDHLPPDLLIAVMAVANRVHAGRPLVGCGLILDRGIKGQKQNVEVTAIDGRQSAPDVAGEDQPPKARSWWQAHQAVGNQAVKDGKAKEQALVQGPALGCSLTRKRDGIPNSAHDVLLRHGPRSISRTGWNTMEGGDVSLRRPLLRTFRSHPETEPSPPAAWCQSTTALSIRWYRKLGIGLGTRGVK
jgi:hypothetical protein